MKNQTAHADGVADARTQLAVFCLRDSPLRAKCSQ